MSVSLATGTAAGEVAGRGSQAAHIPATLVGVLLRVADIFLIGILGLIIHLYYVYPAMGLNSRDVATILVGVLFSAAHFQLFGVYRGDYLFSR